MFSARVQEADFDIKAETATLLHDEAGVGAVVTFTGIVRPLVNGKPLKAMTLEHYPGMAQQQLGGLLDKAREQWPLEAGLIIHRHGRLYPGDNIVLVMTGSKHRHAAFEAAEFLMDWLKTKAPFWKKEELADQEATWVDERDSDIASTDRWS
ncbi:MAG: molybdenum cofactor biosynthesis protein MoaE [Pseudomonadota bacterium]